MLTAAGHGYDVTAERLGISLWHPVLLSREVILARLGESTEPGADPPFDHEPGVCRVLCGPIPNHATCLGVDLAGSKGCLALASENRNARPSMGLQNQPSSPRGLNVNPSQPEHILRRGGSSVFASSDQPRSDFREIVRRELAKWPKVEVERWQNEEHVPREVIAGLGAAGCFHMRWEDGEARGLPLAITLAEEASLVSAGLGLAVTLHSEVFLSLLHRLARSPFQKELLVKSLDGQTVGCFAVTEEAGGSDIGAVSTTISESPNGLQLVGHKRFISNAGRATHAVLLARHEGLPRGGGHSLVVVPLDGNGVTVTGFYSKLGTNACDLAQIDLNVRIDRDQILGMPGMGLLYVLHSLRCERIAVSAQLIAAARHCLRLAVAYMRRRSQFGQRLIDHQALRHRLADSRVKLWAAECYLGAVVDAIQQGHNVDSEVAGLKLYSASVAGLVVDEALQFFGGRGYIRNYPIEQAWRDVRLARIGAGTDEIMREVVGASLDRSDPECERILEDLDRLDLPSM